MKNIGYEVSPILNASGPFGDKSGVYRYRIELLRGLLQLMKEWNIEQKLVLYTINPGLQDKFVLVLGDLINHPNVEILKFSTELVDSYNEIKKRRLISGGGWPSYMPGLARKIHNRILSRGLYQAYMDRIEKSLLQHNVGLVHHSDTGYHRFKNVRQIITVYDLVSVRFPYWQRSETVDLQMRKLELASHCDGVIAISDSTRDDYLQVNQTDQKVVRIYCGSSLNTEESVSWEVAKKSLYDKVKIRLMENKYILYYSTLEPRKGVYELLVAYENLLKNPKYRDYKLVLIGGDGWGGTKKAIENYLDEAYPTKEDLPILMPGFVSDKILVQLIKSSALVVYPSRFEGFGLPVLEAMQLGKCVVTTQVSSIPEVGGEAVVYAEPGNPDSLLQAIEIGLTDHAVYEKNAIDQAKKFSWQRCAEETWKFYEQVAG